MSAHDGDEDARVRQEDDQLPRRAVITVALAALVVTLLGVALAAVMLVRQDGSIRGPRRPTGRVAPREIGIVNQTLVATERRGPRLRAQQREALSRYGWVDRARGVARVPIDQAMDIVAQRAASPAAPAGGAP